MIEYTVTNSRVYSGDCVGQYNKQVKLKMLNSNKEILISKRFHEGMNLYDVDAYNSKGSIHASFSSFSRLSNYISDFFKDDSLAAYYVIESLESEFE